MNEISCLRFSIWPSSYNCRTKVCNCKSRILNSNCSVQKSIILFATCSEESVNNMGCIVEVCKFLRASSLKQNSSLDWRRGSVQCPSKSVLLHDWYYKFLKDDWKFAMKKLLRIISFQRCCQLGFQIQLGKQYVMSWA